MLKPNHRSIAVLVGVLACWLAAAGCSGISRNEVALNYLESAVGLSDADDPDFGNAERDLMDLLAETHEDVRSFPLQRFYAHALLAENQLRAGLTRTSADGGSRSGPNEPLNVDGKLLSALMSSLRHIRLSMDLKRVADGAGYVSREGVRIVPAELEEIGIPTALTRLDLMTLAFYGMLRFDDKVGVFLSRPSEYRDRLLDYDSCLEYLKQKKLPREVEPWVLVAIYRHLEKKEGNRDDEEAFRFAFHAYHRAQPPLDRVTREEIVAWIEDRDSATDLVFQCRNCGTRIDARYQACDNCTQEFFREEGRIQVRLARVPGTR